MPTVVLWLLFLSDHSLHTLATLNMGGRHNLKTLYSRNCLRGAREGDVAHTNAFHLQYALFLAAHAACCVCLRRFPLKGFEKIERSSPGENRKLQKENTTQEWAMRPCYMRTSAFTWNAPSAAVGSTTRNETLPMSNAQVYWSSTGASSKPSSAAVAAAASSCDREVPPESKGESGRRARETEHQHAIDCTGRRHSGSVHSRCLNYGV